MIGQRHRYRAFGLDLQSDLRLPELPQAADAGAEADIRIELHDSAPAARPELPEAEFVAGPQRWCVLRIADVGEFWVRDGREVVVLPSPGGDPGNLRLYLVGSVLGMALQQRGELLLHASAVLRDGRVTCFIGESGAGKSTLAALLGRAGHPVLADDVVVVRADADGRFRAWPGSCLFKLWADAVAHLGLDADQLEPVANRTDKYYVRNTLPPADAGYPLGEIVLLGVTAGDQAASQRRLPVLEALRAIREHAYRPEFVDLLGHRTMHFERCARLAATVPVHELQRPWALARLREIERVLAELRTRD